MRLLLDTNIFLEIILDQQSAEEAKALLMDVDKHVFFVSDFSLHSVGVLLVRRKQHSVFLRFVRDVVLGTGVRIASLSAEDMGHVAAASERFSLDFDDAYQYLLAEKYDLALVSYDSDFDRTDRGRKVPGQLVS